MNQKHFLFIIIPVTLWILSLISTPALAGIIKIQTQTTVETSEDHIQIAVRLSNEGTAPARNLQAHLKLLGETLDSKVDPQLDPGKTVSFDFERNIQGVGPGRYPLTVLVDFHDTNQYPFSALSGTTFSLGSDINPDLAVVSKNITMDKKGKLSLNIKNLGNQKKEISATLVLPKELSTATPRTSFDMDPRSQKTLDFEIRNFSALPGADYPVFCYFEYDLEDAHHTAVSQAAIGIISKENLFRRYRWVWTALAGGVVAAFLIAFFRKREKNQNRPSI